MPSVKINENKNVHSTAIVEQGAQLGEGVSIGAYSIIGTNVIIGENTWIGPHVVISGHTTIGSRNRIFQFSSIGEIPQDKKYQGERSTLVIGDDNTVREYVTINCGTAQGKGCTKIGNRNWIMAYVHIAHDCNVGDDTIFANGTSLAGHVIVEEFAVFGGFTLVHQFCRIGAHSFCAMGTVLNKDLPPYVMASGNYATACGLNKEGLHRRGFSKDCIEALYKSYRLLIRKGNLRSESISEIESLAAQYKEVKKMLDFTVTSKRGVVHSATSSINR